MARKPLDNIRDWTGLNFYQLIRSAIMNGWMDGCCSHLGESKSKKDVNEWERVLKRGLKCPIIPVTNSRDTFPNSLLQKFPQQKGQL